MNGAKLNPNTLNTGQSFNNSKKANPSPQSNPNSNKDVSMVEDNNFDKEKLDRMYAFPASYKEAEIHAIASKFGYSNNKLKNENKQIPVCPCCQNLVATIDIPISYSTIPGKPEVGREVFLLPNGASMYFTFIKMVLFYLLIRLIIFDIFNYISSLGGKFCSKNSEGTDGCRQNNFLNTSGYNLKDIENQQVLQILDILSLVFTIGSIIYFTVVRKQMYKLISWLDFNQVSQMDFSILIENIPLFICDDQTDKNDANFEFEDKLKIILQQKIQNWLNQIDIYENDQEIVEDLQKDFWKFIYSKKKDLIWGQDPIVSSITLCYDLTQMENLTKYRDQLIERYLQKDEAQIASERKEKVKSKRHTLRAQIQQTTSLIPKQRRLDQIPNQIDVLNKEYMSLCKQFAENNTNAFNLSHFTGKAFISFQYQHYRDYFIRQYNNDENFLIINQNKIRISQTNKPEDIYWFNMKVSDSERTKNIFYSYAILFMLLVLSFAGLLGIQFWQKDENTRAEQLQLNKNATTKKDDLIRSNLISICMAILTNIINTILSTSIELLSTMEQHKTKTQRLSSVIIKTIVSQALNTSFIYYIFYLIFQTNPLGKYGLVNQVVNLVTVSGFISVALQVFPPALIFKKIMNKFNYSPDKPINLFQIQLNQALQRPQFNYAVMYSFYIVFTYVVSFYGFIVPSATVLMVVIFFIQYWVDKYNLFRRFSSPVDFGADLIRWIFKIFEFNILFFAGGYFFWSFTVHFDSPPEYRSICIVHFSIAFLYVVLTLFVPSKIRRKLLRQEAPDYDHHSYSYYLNKRKFKKTFFRESPATFCLKQASLDKGNLLPTAPDPIFIKEEQYQKFIDLDDSAIEIEVYDKAEVDYFVNLDNENYDEVAAQQALANGFVNGIINQQGYVNGTINLQK